MSHVVEMVNGNGMYKFLEVEDTVRNFNAPHAFVQNGPKSLNLVQNICPKMKRPKFFWINHRDNRTRELATSHDRG